MKEYIVRENIADAIEKSIYADRVQELIRCKECKFYDGYSCLQVDFWNNDDDYCSRAERREE